MTDLETPRARVVGQDPRRRFLVRFAESRRSTVMNLFLTEIREGRADRPATIVDNLIRRASAEVDLAEARRDRETADRWSLLYHALKGHGLEALDLAAAALAWEATPTAARAQVKAARAAEHRQAWMAGQPVTARQISYLVALGYRGPEPTDRAAAAALIDARKRGAA